MGRPECVVQSSYARSALVFLVVPLLFLALHLRWVFLGDWPLFDFRHFLSPNKVAWWKAVIGGVCFVIGAVRYGPHAFKTLRNGTCVCAIRDASLYSYGRQFALADIENVRSVRGVFRKGLIFEFYDGLNEYVCTIFNENPNPENIAQRLRTRINQSAT